LSILTNGMKKNELNRCLRQNIYKRNERPKGRGIETFCD
jgi:hypothetical protein